MPAFDASTTSGFCEKYNSHISSIGRVSGGTTEAIAIPSTAEGGTAACSNSLRSRIPSSSAVRSRSAASRQLRASRAPSKTPIVTFVLPTSIASSIQRSAPAYLTRNDSFHAIGRAHEQRAVFRDASRHAVPPHASGIPLDRRAIGRRRQVQPALKQDWQTRVRGFVEHAIDRHEELSQQRGP